VAEQGALVSLKDGRFRMTRGEALLREVRVDEVEQLVLLGAITLRSAVTRELLRRFSECRSSTLRGASPTTGGLRRHALAPRLALR
jgi:hypothetical protein